MTRESEIPDFLEYRKSTAEKSPDIKVELSDTDRLVQKSRLRAQQVTEILERIKDLSTALLIDRPDEAIEPPSAEQGTINLLAEQALLTTLADEISQLSLASDQVFDRLKYLSRITELTARAARTKYLKLAFNERQSAADDIEKRLAVIIEQIGYKLVEYYQQALAQNEYQLSKPAPVLSESLIDRLNNDLLAAYLAERPQYNWSTIKPAVKNQVQTLLKEIFSSPVKIDYGNQETYDRQFDLRRRVRELPDRAQDIIFGIWPYDNGKPANDSYQTQAELAARSKIELGKEILLEEYSSVLQNLTQIVRENKQIDYQIKELIQEKFNKFRDRESTFDRFMKSLSINRLLTFLHNPEVRQLFPKGELDIFERYLSLATINQLQNQKDHTDRSVSLGAQLMLFKSPEAIKMVIINSFREAGVSGERPFIGYSRSPLYLYLESLTGIEIERLRLLMPPPIVSSILRIRGLILANHDSFSEPQIDNPELVKFRQDLQNDPEFLDYIYEHLVDYKPKGFIIIGNYDQSGLHQNNQQFQSVTENALLGLVPNSSLRAGQTVRLGNDEDLKIRRAVALNALASTRVERSYYNHFQATVYASGNRVCYVEPSILESTRKRLGYSYNPFDVSKVANPVYQAIEQELLQLATQQLEQENQQEQFYVLGLIKRLPGKLTETTKRAMLSTLEKTRSPNVVGAVIESLAEHARDGDFIALQALLESYPGRQSEIQARIREAICQLIDHLAYNLGKDEQLDASLNSWAPIVGLSVERFRQLLILIHELHKEHVSVLANSYLELADVEAWARLADYPNSISFLKQAIKNYNYLPNIKDVPNLCKILEPGEAAVFRLVDELKKIFPTFQGFQTIIHRVNEILAIAPEQRLTYLIVIGRLETSPSQEIQRLKNELIDQLLTSNDPIGNYEHIERIFVHNNLPMVGKIYSVFAIINPPEAIEHKLSANLSPVLVQASQRRRYYTIYQDLLSIHLRSGNRSLREYLELLRDGEAVLAKAEQRQFADLTIDDQQQLRHFSSHLRTLFEKSQLGQNLPITETIDSQAIHEQIATLRASLRTKPGQSINERLNEMFLTPIAAQSFDEALTIMRQAKDQAHQRGLAIVQQAADQPLTVETGSFMKGVDFDFISHILQNGSVAKEYLGSSASSDATPFDTDISRVTEEDASHGLEGAYNNSLARSYGDLLFVIKDRGQFQKTASGQPAHYEPGRLELFQTTGINEKHYGIRTGFPTTEIDFMVATPNLLNHPAHFDSLCYEIAQNAFYIPIANLKGQVVFTPEMYERYRAIFKGLDRFDGDRFTVSQTPETAPHYPRIQQLKKQIEQDKEKVNGYNEKIKTIIREVLADEKITLKDRFDRSLLGAELHDTGSTGRYTNKVGSYDFDFSLKLDDTDIPKVPTLVAKIAVLLGGQDNNSHAEAENNYYQLRLKDVKIDDQLLDVDIGLTKKSELTIYGSHDAISEKLQAIEREYGHDTYLEVVANIILAKEILTEAKAYKKGGGAEGGLGGIGIENWILANQGNMIEAFRMFWQTAHQESNLRDLTDFKARYHIIDAGYNIKLGRHEHYIRLLSQSGYRNMLQAIENFASDNQIDLTAS